MDAKIGSHMSREIRLLSHLLFAFAPITGAQDMPVGLRPDDLASGQPGARLRLELRPGEKYFRCDGRPTFLLGRNPVGRVPKAYAEQFSLAAAAGERFMRIHFTFLPPKERVGEIDAGMLQAWDAILDAAEKHGLPIGIHFVAPWYGEGHLIGLAQAFDAETGASALFPPGFAPGA